MIADLHGRPLRAVRSCICAVRWGVLIISVTGCGKPTLFRVEGRVTHRDGSPVTEGLVIFEPVDHQTSARGEIRPDGSFILGTHGNGDGAMLGTYKVLIAPPPLPEEGKRPRPPIHPKYQSLETTPLQFTVTDDRKKNHAQIVID